MDFISQYLLANKGTVVPERYTRWAAIHLLACASGRRIYVDHGHFQIRPVMYLCFVGLPASKKTTAMTTAQKMYQKVFPSMPMGASVTTREKIVERMCQEDNIKTYTDEAGDLIPFSPMIFFINELRNFMSFNLEGMVSFLTDMYDQNFFDSETLKHGLQPIVNPYLAILACTTPDWVIDNFKQRVMAGGYTRRMLFIYETELPERITYPHKSEISHVADAWCCEHLRKVTTYAGKMEWDEESRILFDKWNLARDLENKDPVFQGYYDYKDMLAQKVGMCLALAQPEPKLLFTWPLLQTAIAFIEANEDNLPELSVAAGRNELAVPQQRLMKVLADNDGFMLEYIWHKAASEDLNEQEYFNVKKMLISTKQIYEVTGPDVSKFIMTPVKYKEDIELKKIGKSLVL